MFKDYFVYTKTSPLNYNSITQNKKTSGHSYTSVAKLDINKASSLELTSIPSIGNETAKKIIYYRNIKKFDTLKELTKIKGIGPQRYEKMKKYLFITS